MITKTELEVTLAGIRWANSIVVELSGNYTNRLSHKSRLALRTVCTDLANAHDAVTGDILAKDILAKDMLAKDMWAKDKS